MTSKIYTKLEMAIIDAIIFSQKGNPMWNEDKTKVKFSINSQYWHPDQIVDSFYGGLLTKRIVYRDENPT